jgi:hypothetical protein
MNFAIILKKVWKLILLIASFFFMCLALTGSWLFIQELFIQKDPKMWLDWYFCIPIALLGISTLIYLSISCLTIYISKPTIKNIAFIIGKIVVGASFLFIGCMLIPAFQGLLYVPTQLFLIFFIGLPLCFGLMVSYTNKRLFKNTSLVK